MTKLKGTVAGAGYFSRYQYEAWSRIPEVEICALYNRSEFRAREIQKQFVITRYYGDFRQMIDTEAPDFVDIVTPPETHFEMCDYAASKGVAVICQKPLAPTYDLSLSLVETVRKRGVRFMVHENFRWQPWYREIKGLLEAGVLGRVSHLYFRMRTGDGWSDDAYRARQPFFREYPRLLIYETGVHFIDTFRYLLGEIETIYCKLHRLNPDIKGEDAGQVFFGFRGGATAIWDANRYNESNDSNPRYTFGEMRIDGQKGHLELDSQGHITIKRLGEPPYRHPYRHEDRGFAGDCVYAIQRHFVDCLLGNRQVESTGEDYLQNVRVVEACYESARSGQGINLLTYVR
ncbi:MAG: Gfo/Idh/MocA family oxidoreductase [Acidobacteriota bacterium]